MYESLPEETYKACQEVLRPLVAFALECGRQRQFKAKLELVIESVAHLNSEDITQYLVEPAMTGSDLEDGSFSSTMAQSD